MTAGKLTSKSKIEVRTQVFQIKVQYFFFCNNCGVISVITVVCSVTITLVNNILEHISIILPKLDDLHGVDFVYLSIKSNTVPVRVL